jgi:hypothetical protein
VLAGGLAPPLQRSTLEACGCRLTVYAWDYAGNSAARDFTFGKGSGAAYAPPLAPRARPSPAPFARPSDEG